MRVGLGVTAVLATTLFVPRPVAPLRLPLPPIDRLAEEGNHKAEITLLLEPEPLASPLRAVGEAYRGWMRELFAAANTGVAIDPTALQRRQLERLVQEGLAHHSTGEWLRLRAIQTQRFITAAGSWQVGQVPPRELIELGGPFAHDAVLKGWIRDDRFAGDASDLRALFHVHWAEQLGLRDTPGLAPDANTLRHYFHYMLRRSAPGAETLPGLLLAIDAATANSSAYPLALARGVAYFRAGQVQIAAQAFTAYKQRSPHGPWAFRIRNYLAACGQAMSDP
jgi:hypothetical protein